MDDSIIFYIICKIMLRVFKKDKPNIHEYTSLISQRHLTAFLNSVAISVVLLPHKP
jgi:hypothetical protein